MTEQEIREYIGVRFPEENESCEWKEYKNLQNSLCGHEADDVVSYVSAISNMNGGSLIIGVEDGTFQVIGIQNLGSYNVESAKARIAEKCRNLPLEDFDIMELKADDTAKIVWVLTIPKHHAKFLDKAKLTIRGKITRATLVLLGKEDSEHLLSPYVAKIRWSLRAVGEPLNKDYDVFSIPLLLSVDRLYNKVRNVKYRLVRPNTLFPDEMLRYDMFNIREPLNNAIAHQDYTKCARIDIVEYEDDHLIFQNHGHFLPKSIEEVVENDCPESIYRNRFLVEAMRNLNMIETEGGGIRKMFLKQSVRFFPLPEYDLSDGKVKLTIEGKVKDENFAKILSANPDLSLNDIMLLDKVQKGMSIGDIQAKYLRKCKFIEGRKPKYYLSYEVVAASKNSDLKSQYVKNKSFDDDYFRKLILNYLEKFGTASRKDIDLLLKDKLSDVLSDEQKVTKISNLLKRLRIAGTIKTTKNREWKLT